MTTVVITLEPWHIVEILLGSGIVLAAASAIYHWIIKGRVKIPKEFDFPHRDEVLSRHRIFVKNRGLKTLHDLTVRITFTNLTAADISSDELRSFFLISAKNYIPITLAHIIWVTGSASMDLHPGLSSSVDLLHYDRRARTITVPSELGYTDRKLIAEFENRRKRGKASSVPRRPTPLKEKARVRIGNLREYEFRLRFFAEDYRSKEYRFKIIPPLGSSPEGDITIRRVN